MTATIPFIQINQVGKTFSGTTPVLKDINFNINRGEFIAIIGPSGCGKSTLLKLIANLISATTGTIIVGGGKSDFSPEKLGFVFQEANLLPWLTTEQNIALPLKLRKTPSQEIKTKVEQLLQLVGLSDRAKHFPRQLSGGMRMRVSIARALSTNPELLLLDEPFGALDEMTRDDLNESLLLLREKNPWTAAFVTHSITESVFLGSKVLVLSANPGQIYQVIDVPFAYPRTAELRTTPEFQAKVSEVTACLHSLRAL
ncbi:ABC transporter ATP-binding protein [Halioxenophilus sp. WMMB6]|uniref:ABC transporter ATP-binding protein n=1 Tax=Halioxenophilus sp. WMMB6 TaxID=3073815 RepID=UPI00295EA077|nr:ABC transporter ATP-binding protein [Halioxenophilus sp. WMMB6]